MAAAYLAGADATAEAVAEGVSTDDFYDPRAAALWRALAEIIDRGELPAPATLEAQLRAHGDWVLVGRQGVFSAYLADFHTVAATRGNARLVRRASRARAVILAAAQVVEHSDSDTEVGDLDEFVGRAEASVLAAAQQGDTQNWQHIDAFLIPTFTEIAARGDPEASEVRGVPSGIGPADALTLGLQPGDLAVLGARPSHGKSALAFHYLDAATPTRLPNGEFRAERLHPVLLFSAEMSARQVVERRIVQVGEVDYGRLRRGRFLAEDMQRMIAACEALQRSAVWIDDSRSPTIAQLRARARRWRRRETTTDGPPALVIVDYLQLVRGTRKAENREREVAEITAGLRDMAKELDVAVLALAQVKREVDLRRDPRPTVADLRESTAIEADADVVMLLSRPERYHRDDTPADVRRLWAGAAWLDVAKQRLGEVGAFKLAWRGSVQRFAPLAEFAPGE